MRRGEFAHVLLERGSKGGDPAGVALKGATEYELLGHDCGEWLLLRMDVGALDVVFGSPEVEGGRRRQVRSKITVKRVAVACCGLAPSTTLTELKSQMSMQRWMLHVEFEVEL